MAEIDSSLVPPQAGLTQPRRGFGLVWRSSDTIRNGLGWATQDSEQGYTVRIQTGLDNAIYLSQPDGSVLRLLPTGASSRWEVIR